MVGIRPRYPTEDITSLSVVFPRQVRCEDAGYYDCTTNIRGSDGNSEENTKSESLKVTGSLFVSFPNHESLVSGLVWIEGRETAHPHTNTDTDRQTDRQTDSCTQTQTHSDTLGDTRKHAWTSQQTFTNWVTPAISTLPFFCIIFHVFGVYQFARFSSLVYHTIKQPLNLFLLLLMSPTVLAKSVCFCSSESWSFHTDSRRVCFRAESGWRTEA